VVEDKRINVRGKLVDQQSRLHDDYIPGPPLLPDKCRSYAPIAKLDDGSVM
jgi:hypothetical protein